MNAVKGLQFKACFPQFDGSYRKPKYLGDAIVEGIITVDTNYDKNNKHWIYFECTASDSPAYEVGKTYKKQGKNFYSQVTGYTYPDNYSAVAAQKQLIKEAHLLGNCAIGRA